MNWYIKVVKDHYFDFNGRASRQELWMFILFNVIFAFCLGILDVLFGTYDDATGRGLISSIYTLAVILPGLGVQVRRLHDIGKSGWLILLSFIPLIGLIVLIVWYCQEGQPEPNEYGVNPNYDNPDDGSEAFFQS